MTVEFILLPSHVDIRENELADKVSYAASMKPEELRGISSK